MFHAPPLCLPACRESLRSGFHPLLPLDFPLFYNQVSVLWHIYDNSHLAFPPVPLLARCTGPVPCLCTPPWYGPMQSTVLGFLSCFFSPTFRCPLRFVPLCRLHFSDTCPLSGFLGGSRGGFVFLRCCPPSFVASVASVAGRWSAWRERGVPWPCPAWRLSSARRSHPDLIHSNLIPAPLLLGSSLLRLPLLVPVMAPCPRSCGLAPSLTGSSFLCWPLRCLLPRLCGPLLSLVLSSPAGPCCGSCPASVALPL
jgi:hypothetical protein